MKYVWWIFALHSTLFSFQFLFAWTKWITWNDSLESLFYCLNNCTNYLFILFIQQFDFLQNQNNERIRIRKDFCTESRKRVTPIERTNHMWDECCVRENEGQNKEVLNTVGNEFSSLNYIILLFKTSWFKNYLLVLFCYYIFMIFKFCLKNKIYRITQKKFSRSEGSNLDHELTTL